MSSLKNLTKKQLFLPIFSMILVMLINVIYDIACGNAPLSFFQIAIKNDVLYGRLIDVLNCMLLAGYGVARANSYALPLWVGLLGGVLVACVCGLFNGFLVAYLNIQPMVATLILWSAGRAIGLLLCNSQIRFLCGYPSHTDSDCGGLYFDCGAGTALYSIGDFYPECRY